MSRIKQILFYGIMVMATLLTIEAMAQAAYYIAYGEFNGVGPAPAAAVAPAAAAELANPTQWLRRVSHPYYGHTRTEAAHPLNRVPPPRRADGAVLIALLGGSVARDVAAPFRNALGAWFRDNAIPLRPVVLQLGVGAMKQPQQVMIVANTLSLGGEYDLIVNLDGHNELYLTQVSYFDHGLSPFYPHWWQQQQLGLTDAQKLVVSRIYALRLRQQRLDATAGAPPWRWSALYGIVNRYLRENAAAQIQTLNHELLNDLSGEYSLQRYGPRLAAAPDQFGLSELALRVWYRGSVLLHELAAAAGAEYYHFQQPNQYVPDAKPLSDRELAVAYDAENPRAQVYPQAYPLLLRLGAELRRQGVNYHDLTQIFADHRETLYTDRCCHLNELGNRLLAESMVARLAPALRNRAAIARSGNAPADATATALYPATYETTTAYAVNKLHFDVRLADAAAALHYSRADCQPADTAAPFYLQVTPADAADLTPAGAAAGANRYDFAFEERGGTSDAAGRCVMEYPLPDYAIDRIQTGQYGLDTGQPLWRARITPDVRFEVAVAADGGVLRYSRADCTPAHTAPPFFLHLTPADAADLPAWRAAHGFDNLDFEFRYSDGIMDDTGGCVVERPLPAYAIAGIRTGQYLRSAGRQLWETRLDLE